MTTRPVDLAMIESRPEKKVIRQLWLDELRKAAAQYDSATASEPLYLTLCGAEGYDIQMVMDAGLVAKTETGGIAEADQNKIVAVENSNEAVLQLQRKYFGLKIKEAPIQNLIRGEGIFAWPNGDDESCCRARVVNLDLNLPLKATVASEDTQFPVLAWIKKLCQIHSRAPHLNWTLCLTLHGEVVWPEKVNAWTKDFLIDNFRRDAAFATSCRDFLGGTLADLIIGSATVDFTTLDREHQQRLIMVMVPKLITRYVYNEGWLVSTERNLRYGSVPSAPMVTWIVNFTWSGNTTATPDALYKTALENIFAGAGVINNKGKIKRSN